MLGNILAILFGFISAYAQGPTDATLQYRGMWPADPKLDGYIAVADCGRIGQYAKLGTAAGVLNVRVFDCGGDDGGHSWMIENNIVVEVDWYLWERYPEIVGGKAKLVYLED